VVGIDVVIFVGVDHSLTGPADPEPSS